MKFLGEYKYIAKDGVAEFERAKATNAKTYTAIVTGRCMTISSKTQPTKKTPKSPNNTVDTSLCIALVLLNMTLIHVTIG